MSSHERKPESRTSVLFITPANDLGGVSRYLIGLMEALPRGAFELSLATGRGSALSSHAESVGVRSFIVPMSYSFFGAVRHAFSFRRFLNAHPADVLHAHTTRAGLLAALAMKRDSRLVFTSHSWRFLQKKNPLAKLLFYLIARFICFRSSAVICISETERNEALAYRLAPESKLWVIPFCLDAESFAPEGEGAAAWRERLMIPDGAPVVVMVGRLVKEKDHPTFLRAASAVLKSAPAAAFVWVGGGELEGVMRRDISALGLSGSVRVTGMVGPRDVRALLTLASVFFFSSDMEGLPISVLEAMALGKPIVASDVGGVRELIDGTARGRLFARGDAENAARMIVSALSDASLASSLGREAARFARARHGDASRFGALHAALFRKLSGWAGCGQGGFSSR